MRDQNTEKLVEIEKHVAVKHYIREEKSQDVQNADGIRAVECLGLIFLLGMYIDNERKTIAFTCVHFPVKGIAEISYL